MSDTNLDHANRATWARLNTEDYLRTVAQYSRKETKSMPQIPPLDPDNTETRLLRAIFGACPDCNETSPHEHPCKTCGAEQPLPDGSYCWHE